MLNECHKNTLIAGVSQCMGTRAGLGVRGDGRAGVRGGGYLTVGEGGVSLEKSSNESTRDPTDSFDCDAARESCCKSLAGLSIS